MSEAKIRALLVDDEPLARALVRRMLDGHHDVEIVGECESGTEAIAALATLAPDLVFLDVQMPERDGFAVIESLPATSLPHIIFTTAYDQYALRAFEVHALDYLLKPFDRERFEAAVNRAVRQIRSDKNGAATERILALLGERRDNNGDGNFNDRPDVARATNPQAIPTIFGALNPSAVNGTLSRNIGTNPATATLDVNLTRTFAFGKQSADGDSRYRMALNIRASNLLNRTNPLGLNGVLASPFFGRANAAAPARRVELGVRFNF